MSYSKQAAQSLNYLKCICVIFLSHTIIYYSTVKGFSLYIRAQGLPYTTTMEQNGLKLTGSADLRTIWSVTRDLTLELSLTQTALKSFIGGKGAIGDIHIHETKMPMSLQLWPIMEIGYFCMCNIYIWTQVIISCLVNSLCIVLQCFDATSIRLFGSW